MAAPTRIGIVVFAILFFVSSTRAQGYVESFNPGIKVGHTLGNYSEWTFGIELSYAKVRKAGSIMWGAIFDIDFSKGLTQIHLGAQAGALFGFIGASVGPVYIVKGAQEELGVRGTSFFGALLYPYGAITISEHYTIPEIGCYAKYYMHLRGNMDFPAF